MFQCSVVYNANYNSTADILINQGGTSCFHPDTLIVTQNGSKPIKDISIGDVVLSFNEDLKVNEWKKVVNTFKYQNTKNTIRVKLKNGKEIICTDDHKFYYKGGWISIKHLLSLKHENNP